MVDESYLRSLLNIDCFNEGSQKKWADRAGISQSYVSAVLKQKSAISEKLALALGYRRVVGFIKIEEGGDEQ